MSYRAADNLTLTPQQVADAAAEQVEADWQRSLAEAEEAAKPCAHESVKMIQSWDLSVVSKWCSSCGADMLSSYAS